MARGLSSGSQGPARFFAALALTLSVGSAGCPNPEKDYDDFTAMAQAKANAPAPTAGSGGGGGSGPAPTDFDVNGKFVAYCLSVLGLGDPAKSLNMATEFKQEGTNLTVTLDPLLTKATTLADVAGGTPVTVMTKFEGAKFTIEFGTVKVPGMANPISGTDIEVNNTLFRGVVQSNDKLCAELDGSLVKPFKYDLTKPGDICIILRAPADGSLPPRPKADEFVCGGILDP